ncbi:MULTISPECIES: efflux RND transporter periplasmic adaptor subunit [Acetobacter]|uniref:efflux RND transporter periplasmic adaptor subunit n=1 Tax=Acetobacter TaxID=434 RepID=UPI00376F8BC0
MKKLLLLCFASAFPQFVACAAEQALPADISLDAAAVSHEGITVFTVESGMVFPTIPVVCQVMPDTTRLVHIHPAGNGKVLAVLVQPGTHVRYGQPLLRYQDHSLHVAQLQDAQTQAALNAAIAAQHDAAQAVQRAQLLAGQAVSIAELHRRQDALAQANANVRTRQADADTLGHRFKEEFNSVSEQGARKGRDETSTLIAPVDGVVQTLDVSVAADLSPAQDVMTLADLSSVWIVSDVTPEQAAHTQPGARQSTETTAGPVISRINTVGAMASPLTGLVRLISIVPNPTGTLVPGMVLNGTLSEKDGVRGLVVPSEAIQKIAGQSVVFVQKDNTHYRPVMVDVAMDNGEQAVIHAGLKEGEHVVAHGSFALRSVVELAGMDAD